MNLLISYIGKRVELNPGNLDTLTLAKIVDVDDHGILLEIIKSPKPYLTGYHEGSNHYFSNANQLDFRILEDEN